MYILNIEFLEKNPNGAFIVKIDKLGYMMVGVPKDKIPQAYNCDKVPSQGVYFLVNTSEAKTTKRYIYIGQTKEGPKRLIDHKQKKADWNLAFMFLGKKETLSLQLVDELEALEINKYKDNEAFNCVNSRPNKAEASEETNDVSNIIENVLTFFGYGSEESLKIYKNDQNKEEIDISTEVKKESNQGQIYYLKRSKYNISAKMIKENGKYKVLEGSTYIIEYKKSFPSAGLKLRNELLEKGIMNNGVFITDYSFDSKSSAASQILGTSANGNKEWVLYSEAQDNDISQTLEQTSKSKAHKINEDLDLTKTKLTSFSYGTTNYAINSYKDFFLKVCEIIYESDKVAFTNLARESYTFPRSKRPIATYNKSNFKSPVQIKNSGFYIETNRSANDILSNIKKLFELFKLDKNELVFYLE